MNDQYIYALLSGENVNAFFSRVAALTFEQAVLKELETQDRRQHSNGTKIGGGGIVSEYLFSLLF